MVATLRRLSEEGVSLWLAGLDRGRLTDGGLTRLVRDRYVVGATAAAVGGEAYREQLAELAAAGASAGVALRELTVRDLRLACDTLAPIHRRTAGLDGLVATRIDPACARAAGATLAEARSLCWAVDRPNLLVEIPATPEALPAISRCLAEGIGVQVSLILGQERYGQVLEAFLTGLEQAAENGLDISRISSVAAIPVALLDSAVDHELEIIGTPQARAFRSQAATALARLVYRRYEQEFRSPRWTALAGLGARPQRLLWEATEVTDSQVRDTRYVDALVAPNSVTVLTECTLAALTDHGSPVTAGRFTGGYADAERVFGYLDWFGVDLPAVAGRLERDVLAALRRARTELLATLLADLAGLGLAAVQPPTHRQ